MLNKKTIESRDLKTGLGYKGTTNCHSGNGKIDANVNTNSKSNNKMKKLKKEDLVTEKKDKMQEEIEVGGQEKLGVGKSTNNVKE